MGLITRYLRVPRPTTFLYVMNLRTGVEMISLAMIFNKLAGFYGLLAVLTGVHLSPLQLSMYIYSIIALFLVAFLAPHIRKQSPFECLALAWIYLFDTVINTAFTAAFAMTWFLAISADHANQGIPGGAPGSGTIDDTAGFTSPKYNVSSVEVVGTSAAGPAGQESVTLAAVGGVAAAASGASPSLGHAVGLEESIPSIFVVVVLTLIRVYFILIVMAYARQVLRQHMFSTSTKVLHVQTEGTTDVPADNPFAIGSSGGEGWRGKVGRVMVKISEGYWLGGQADDSWVKGLDTRFRTRAPNGPRGTLERERRARSGTGPPAPPLNIGKV